MRVALAILGLLAALPARAQQPDEVPLEDLLELIHLEHQILAIDAEGGGQTGVELELGEKVVWSRSRGQVGVVLTDRRVLAVGTGSASWQGTRYRRTEQVPNGALLGDRVALLHTRDRVLGFDGGTGNLLEYRLGPQEYVVTSRTGANVALAITNRSALGLSPQAGGFFPVSLQIRERIVDLIPRSNLVTVRTDRRLLIFRGPTGSWEERELELSDVK
jgi:hypothetical protein